MVIIGMRVGLRVGGRVGEIEWMNFNEEVKKCKERRSLTEEMSFFHTK